MGRKSGGRLTLGLAIVKPCSASGGSLRWSASMSKSSSWRRMTFGRSTRRKERVLSFHIWTGLE